MTDILAMKPTERGVNVYMRLTEFYRNARDESMVELKFTADDIRELNEMLALSRNDDRNISTLDPGLR